MRTISSPEPIRTRQNLTSEHPSLGKDTLIGLKVREKCLVTSAPFLLALKKLCSTPGSFYPACTTSMIKPLGKATPLLIHARSYPISKGLQPYKGTLHTLMVLSPNYAKIKIVASNQNSFQEEMLSKNCQESQDIMSPRILPRKTQERLSRIQKLPQGI